MSQLKIKQIRGSKPGSILFLGDDYSVVEDFNNINWSSQNSKLNIDGSLYIKSKTNSSSDSSVVVDNSSDINLLKVKNNGDVSIKGKVSGKDATEPNQFVTLGQLGEGNYLKKGDDSVDDFSKISSMSKSEYDDLTTKDPNTLYVLDTPLNPLGYIQYIDTEYTESNRYVIEGNITKLMPNNSNIINSEGAPETGDNFYNNGGFNLINKFDRYNISVSFKLKAFKSTNISFIISLKDSNGVIKQDSRRLPEGANTEFPVDFNLSIISTQESITTGCFLDIKSLGGDIEIYDIEYIVDKLYDING